MNFTKKLTYFNALSIPFRIAPLETSLLIFNRIVGIVIAPIALLVTAYFLDTARIF